MTRFDQGGRNENGQGSFTAAAFSVAERDYHSYEVNTVILYNTTIVVVYDTHTE